MIIDKVEPFWTDKDREEFDAWDAKSADISYNYIVEGKEEEYKSKVEAITAGKALVRARVAARYLKARGKRGVLADCKEILAAVTRQDYIDTLVDMQKLMPLLDKMEIEAKHRFENLFSVFIEENYANACGYLRAIVGAQLESLEGTPQYQAALDLIERTAARWYPRTTFSTIRQSTSTNALTKMRAILENGNGTGNTSIDAITGEATITSGSLILKIPQYEQLVGLRTSTYQLLDAITIALTENGAKSPTVYFSVEDYMRGRDLKDRKDARRQLTEDLAVLLGITLTETGSNGGKGLPLAGVAMSDSWKWVDKQKTVIEYTFGSTFYKAMLGFPVMPYPSQLQTVNNKRNPNSYYLLRKIAEHKNMNVGKHNEDIISVQTLLEAAPHLPSFDEVMKKDRALGRRIIEPFERDMNALDETLTWEYCHSKGTPLTDAELQDMSYSIFKDLLVKITWRAYPDQTARLALKAERKAKAEKAKTAKKPKKSKTDGSGN